MSRWSRWCVTLALAACGSVSNEKTDAAVDRVPSGIDWPDFENLSTDEPITGIDGPIEVTLDAAYATGTPALEYRVSGGPWQPMTLGATTISVMPDATLQFRVSGTTGHAAFITVTNASTGGTLLDSMRGSVTSLVTGNGSQQAPYAAPDQPKSCAAFLAVHPEQSGRDGLYTLKPSSMLDAYCDMTSDTGGWTLVARVLAASTSHDVAGSIGLVFDPSQQTTAKLADATINQLGFMHGRFLISGVGTVYARVTSLDLTGNAFSIPNASASAFTGPYVTDFTSSTGCSGDCGVAIVVAEIGFGRFCGYRYYLSAGTAEPGMGCKGNFGKVGTVWVR
jgi:hypothetical protein